MEKTPKGTCLGKNISSLVRYIGYLNEDVKEAVGYITMEFGEELEAGNINLENSSKYIEF